MQVALARTLARKFNARLLVFDKQQMGLTGVPTQPAASGTATDPLRTDPMEGEGGSSRAQGQVEHDRLSRPGIRAPAVPSAGTRWDPLRVQRAWHASLGSRPRAALCTCSALDHAGRPGSWCAVGRQGPHWPEAVLTSVCPPALVHCTLPDAHTTCRHVCVYPQPSRCDPPQHSIRSRQCALELSNHARTRAQCIASQHPITQMRSAHSQPIPRCACPRVVSVVPPDKGRAGSSDSSDGEDDGADVSCRPEGHVTMSRPVLPLRASDIP